MLPNITYELTPSPLPGVYRITSALHLISHCASQLIKFDAKWSRCMIFDITCLADCVIAMPKMT